MAKQQKAKEKETAETSAEEVVDALNEVQKSAGGKGGSKKEKSIEHIRELLVGKLARALRKQLDDIRADMEGGDKELRNYAADIDKRHSQQIAESRDSLNQQIEETGERFTHKVDTVNTALLGKFGELDTRLSNTNASLENAEKRLRNEISARVEDVANQGRESSAKLEADLKARANDLNQQIADRGEQVNEQLVDIRRTIDVRGRQMKDELNAFVLGTADGLRKTIDGLAAAMETDKTEMRSQTDKRFTEITTTIKEMEKRLSDEIEEQVADLSTRVMKRIETAESVFTARTGEIENQVESLRNQTEERSRHMQSMLDATENELRETVRQSNERTESFSRGIKDDLERKLVFREDIGNKLIEMGMRLTKDLTSGDIVKAIEDSADDDDMDALDSMDVSEEGVTSVDDILNLMNDDDEAAPPPKTTTADDVAEDGKVLNNS